MISLDSVNLLYYKCHKISLNRGGSYIDTLKHIINKKATINPKKNVDKCFQYTAIIALHHEDIKHSPERISKQLESNIFSIIQKRLEKV